MKLRADETDIKKYVEDVKQHEKHVPNLLEAIMRLTFFVKEELRVTLCKMDKFGPEIPNIRVSLFVIFVTILLTALLYFFFAKTRLGIAMVAASQNQLAAFYVGIPVKRVQSLTWIIAGILATIGGALYGLDKSFKPFTYFNNMLPIFAAAIVGGIGNPFGAFLGGYVIAFSEILLTYAYKKFFMYILPESMAPESLVQLLSTDYKFAVSFSILVIVLLYRPSGIFKGKVL